jgi:hypothetical protein
MNSTNQWILGVVMALIVGFLAGYFLHKIQIEKPSSPDDLILEQMLKSDTSVVTPASAVPDTARIAKHASPDSQLDERTLDSDSVIEFPGSTIPDTAAGIYLPIYGLDNDHIMEEIRFYFRVPKRQPLVMKVACLAERLSSVAYGGLPIEVFPFAEQDGKQIARINLKESPGGRSWSAGYFQGSTGGWATTVTLKQSFLQPEYTGEWVDGVQFYYEGKPMSGEWDHINLNGVFFRDGN